MELEPMMDLEETAQYLRLHQLTTRRLAQEGAIPAFKAGWQWRVKRELLDKWLDEQSIRNLGEAADGLLEGASRG